MQVFFVVLVSLDFFQPPLPHDTDIADNNNERRIYVLHLLIGHLASNASDSFRMLARLDGRANWAIKIKKFIRYLIINRPCVFYTEK